MRDSTKGILIGILSTLAVVALGLVAWRLGSRAGVTLTDGSRIRVPASIAPVREVLWEPADVLPDWINQGDETYEPRLSADGRTLVFVRGKAGGNADLFAAHLGPDGWTPPAPLAGVNSALADELGPALSADGRTLYFYSDRDGGQGGYDLWLARRTDDPPAPSIEGATWSEAENLGPGVNGPFNDYGPAPSPSGDTLYFASNRPLDVDTPEPTEAWPATVREQFERRTYDLYASPSTERGFGLPERLVVLSTTANEGTPAVSPAGDFIYFSSDRPGGAGGLDIYRARIRDGLIDTPHAIGWPVNSPANELDPAISSNGFALHFSSSRDLAMPGSQPATTDPSQAGTTRAPLASNAGTPDAPERPRYAIYSTISREVYREREPLLAGFNWAAAWGAVWPWLLLLALVIGMLALLRRLMRDEQLKRRWRTLSLLAKCLILSLMLHAMLGGLFTVWYVAGSVGELLNGPSGGTRVALVSRAVSGDLASQIRGGLTQVRVDPVSTPGTRATPTLDIQARLVGASLPTELARTADEPIEPARLASDEASPQPTAPRSESQPRTEIAAQPPDVTLPESLASPAASEARLVATAAASDVASPAVVGPSGRGPAQAELSAERAGVIDRAPLSTAMATPAEARHTQPERLALDTSAIDIPANADAAPVSIGSLGTPRASTATSTTEAQVRVTPAPAGSALPPGSTTLPLSTTVTSTSAAMTPAEAPSAPDASLPGVGASRTQEAAPRASPGPARTAPPMPSLGPPGAISPVVVPSVTQAMAGDEAGAAERSATPSLAAPGAPSPALAIPMTPGSSTSTLTPVATASVVPQAEASLVAGASRAGDAPAPAIAPASQVPGRTPSVDLPTVDDAPPLELPTSRAGEPGRQEAGAASLSSAESEIPASSRPGLALPSAPAAAGSPEIRPESSLTNDASLARPDTLLSDARSPSTPAPAIPSTLIPLDAAPMPIASLALPESIDEPPAPAEPIGTLAGVVRDATTGEPIAAARIRLDLPGVEPIVARSSSRGQYRLRVPAGVPDNVAISATAPGFTPASINVRADELAAAQQGGQSLSRDFDLSPLAWDVVPIEADPQVHHLGNDEFEGAINSQFQRASEGLVYRAEFTLGRDQIGSSIRAAELLILAKGAQANNPVRINGRDLDAFIVATPRDGAFGELVFTIPPRWLREGVNTIEVESVRGSNDLDDFEFVNPRLRLRPSAAREPTPGE